MTQFAKRTHRARARLQEVSKEFRWLFDAAEEVRQQGATWPACIYVPVPALNETAAGAMLRHFGHDAVRQMMQDGNAIAHLLSAGLTWATWRMTQGIYRFDPALYPALIDTPQTGDIPADVLTRLPEWCVYVETPGLTLPPVPPSPEPVPLHGAWARLDIGARGETLLAITPDADTGGVLMPPTQHIALGAGSIEESLAAALREWVQHGGRADSAPEAIVQAIAGWLRPVINLLLYLCADPDISRRGQPATPANPQPKKTRRDGWRLFAADGPAEWDVGVRIGAALRAAYHAAETGQGSPHAGPRGHVRRAHWHTFVSGPRKDQAGADIPAEQRNRAVRWMPPIPVNLGDLDALPATIRTVK